MALRTEADVVRTLKSGSYPLSAIYAACENAGDEVIGRQGGHQKLVDYQERWQRRVRGALQTLRRAGMADAVGHGVWAIHGTEEEPTGAVLVLLPHDPGRMELVLGEAHEILAHLEEPATLVIADPPYALGVGRGDDEDTGARVYQRNDNKVVSGYVDWDPEEYRERTTQWVQAAAQALRPGGYLAAISGPSRTGWIQVAGEDAGLTYVNRVVVKRPFALKTTRRFAHAHNEVTIFCRGPLTSSKREFVIPADLPKARNGADYPLDFWDDVPKEERHGLLRYNNALPSVLVRRLVRSLSAVGDLVCDPFLGSGTSLLVCLQEGRRFVGGDVNALALRFSMARSLDEWLCPEGQGTLALGGA
jgi:DNA modification methylase